MILLAAITMLAHVVGRAAPGVYHEGLDAWCERATRLNEGGLDCSWRPLSCLQLKLKEVQMITIVSHLLTDEEGFRERPYYDADGSLRIGYGTLLTRVKITEPQARVLMQRDVQLARAVARSVVGADFLKLLPARQAVLTAMCYQLGRTRFASMHIVLRQIQEHNWTAVAEQMRMSLWGAQCPNRAKRAAEIMRTGSLPANKGTKPTNGTISGPH